jgi:predicted transcriptional regulator
MKNKKARKRGEVGSGVISDVRELFERARKIKTPLYVIAQHVGVSPSAISRWRSGDVSPSMVAFRKVMNELERIEKSEAKKSLERIEKSEAKKS